MSLNTNWVLQIDPVVYKFLDTIPRKDSARIFSVINVLPTDPFHGDIQKMSGEENVWRKRVGAYRIKYELLSREKIIHVFRAERRTSSIYHNTRI